MRITHQELDPSLSNEIKNIPVNAEKYIDQKTNELSERITDVELSSVLVNPNKWKSGNVSVFGRKTFSDVYNAINKLNINTVTYPILIEAVDENDSNPVINQESYDEAKEVVPQLIEKGYKVIIEPYPYIAEGTVVETDWNPTDVDLWFTNWNNELTDIATFADSINAKGLYIASNLIQLESYIDKWTTVIENVRKAFSGNVIYRTNWWITASWAPELIDAYEAKLNNPIFGLVDVIAIASYFELTDNENATVEELIANIYHVSLYDRGQNIYQEIKNFYDKWNKPIFLGELGVPPYKGAYAEPWNYEWDESLYDEKIQENWFKAFYSVFGSYDWFKGFSIYSIADDESVYNIVKSSENVIRSMNFGGSAPFDGDYNSLKNKPNATTILTTEGTNIQEEIDNLKSSVSDGKMRIATAITDKGVIANGSDTFPSLADKIKLIETGINTDDATAQDLNILAGKTAYVKGQKILGTMVERGSIGTVTPSTSNKSYGEGHYNAFTVAGSSNLTAGNIRNGVNIFGVTGNYQGQQLKTYFTNLSIPCYAQSGHSVSLSRQTINCGFAPMYWIASFSRVTFNGGSASISASVNSENETSDVNVVSSGGARDLAISMSDTISGNTLYLDPIIWQSMYGQYSVDTQTITVRLTVIGTG